MNARIDWPELFFSSSGRVGRLPFLLAVVSLVVILALYQSALGGNVFTGVFAYPVLFFSAACVLAKRLHDRGRSGWWTAVILFAFIMIWPHPEGVLDFLGLGVVFWAVVELGLLPSEQGSNRFGPNPMRAMI